MAFERAVWQVDLGILKENFSLISSKLGNCRKIAVVKADAYGFGLMPVAETLAGMTDIFAVAELGEAIEVAKLGKPVLIFGALFGDEIAEAVHHDIIIPVGTCHEAEAVSAEARRQGVNAKVLIPVDTGMGRIGICGDHQLEDILRIAALDNIELSGIYTHCPTASIKNDAATTLQLEKFRFLVAALVQRGVSFPAVHIAASDAICNYPDSLQAPFTHARIGVVMYGADPKFMPEAGLRSVGKFSSRLLEVRKLAAGVSIGYGRTLVLKKPTLVGTVGCGYASGLPLAFSNRGRFLVRGVSCNVLGRVSMDYTTISLENCPDAQVGDEAVALGDQGDQFISAAEWAEIKNTHVHEVLCGISGRVQRRYINGK